MNVSFIFVNEEAQIFELLLVVYILQWSVVRWSVSSVMLGRKKRHKEGVCGGCTRNQGLRPPYFIIQPLNNNMLLFKDINVVYIEMDLDFIFGYNLEMQNHAQVTFWTSFMPV